MNTYSEDSQKKLKAAMKLLDEAIAEVAETENTSVKKVQSVVSLYKAENDFTLERSENPFNLFCKEFKKEYSEKKEELVNEYPGKTFIQIAQEKFHLLEEEERLNLKNKASEQACSEKSPKKVFSGIRKIETIRKYMHRELDVQSFLMFFLPESAGSSNNALVSTAYGEIGQGVRDLVEKANMKVKNKVSKTPAKTVLGNRRKTELGKRLLKLHNEQTGSSSTKLYYSKMVQASYPVQCLGWPKEARFTSHTELNSIEFDRVVEAMDKQEIKFVLHKNVADNAAGGTLDTQS